MIEALSEAPRLFVTKLIEKKLQQAGVAESEALADALLDHIRSGSEEPFVWTDGVDDSLSKHANIEITPEELEKAEQQAIEFIHNEAPALISRALDEGAAKFLRSLKRRWADEKLRQHLEIVQFQAHLEERWGKGFDALRMMLTIAREMGEAVAAKNARSKARHNLLKRRVVSALHARACQVTAEIISLMENGFADGAMARWRTLHEITTVTVLIAEYGDDLAQRYLEHELVDAKRALDKHLSSHQHSEDIPQSEITQVNEAYREILAVYGKEFGLPYGWAAHHLKLAKPTFADLEAAAGRVPMRSIYHMASHNIHAGPRGLSFKLGLLEGTDLMLAGASNAGFDEPGGNTAFSLTQMTSYVLFGPWKFDNAIEMMVLLLLRDEAVRELRKASLKLEKEHRSELKSLRARTSRRQESLTGPVTGINPVTSDASRSAT